jgi:HSP20 family protein
MALVRYQPRSAFAAWPEFDFSNRLSRVFGSAWDTPEPPGNWIPAVNVEEAADELLLTAELPGIREEDVSVEIKNNILTIRGEKREAREEGADGQRHHGWERRYGSFQRVFTPPTFGTGRYHSGGLRTRRPYGSDAEGRRGQEPHDRDQGKEEVTIGGSGVCERA